MTDTSDAFRIEVLDLLFFNLAIALIGDAAGLQPSAAAGAFAFSLHTADPKGGDQSTSEATYTGYNAADRHTLNRNTTDFQRSANTASNKILFAFDQKTDAGSQTLTHVGLGTATSGAGLLLFGIELTDPMVLTQNVTPQFAVGQFSVTLT